MAEAGVTPGPVDNVICPARGAGWAFDPGEHDDDRCPHCGHENGALPFLLGIV